MRSMTQSWNALTADGHHCDGAFDHVPTSVPAFGQVILRPQPPS
jgi:hypothetical protein